MTLEEVPGKEYSFRFLMRSRISKRIPCEYCTCPFRRIGAKIWAVTRESAIEKKMERFYYKEVKSVRESLLAEVMACLRYWLNVNDKRENLYVCLL